MEVLENTVSCLPTAQNYQILTNPNGERGAWDPWYPLLSSTYDSSFKDGKGKETLIWKSCRDMHFLIARGTPRGRGGRWYLL